MEAVQDGLPESRRHLKLFVFFALLAVFVLYWLDLQLAQLLEAKTLPPALLPHAGILRSLFENLIAGAIAAILLALGARWVVAAFDPRDRVIEVGPTSITSRLVANAAATRTYTFMGNTASFVVASVLPILVDAARRSGHPRTVRLFVMDPTASAAITSYVAYRDRVSRTLSRDADRDLARWVSPKSQPHPESVDGVAAKVLSAIYLAAYAATHAGVDTTVYLRRSFTPSRVDMSDREVVLTQEAKDEAAVAFSATGHFYGWFQKQADAEREQSISIDLSGRREDLRALSLPGPTGAKEDVQRALLGLLSIFPHLEPLAANKDLLAKASSRIIRPQHPYE